MKVMYYQQVSANDDASHFCLKEETNLQKRGKRLNIGRVINGPFSEICSFWLEVGED